MFSQVSIIYATMSWVGKIVATAEHLKWSARALCKRKIEWERVCAYRKTKTRKGKRERENIVGKIDGDKCKRKPCRGSSRLTEVGATK